MRSRWLLVAAGGFGHLIATSKNLKKPTSKACWRAPMNATANRYSQGEKKRAHSAAAERIASHSSTMCVVLMLGDSRDSSRITDGSRRSGSAPAYWSWIATSVDGVLIATS